MAPTKPRGFTVPELLISMTIMGIVLALAVLEFAMVFNHNTLMNANLSADQNARIAMAKVTNELRQAMPDFTDYSTGQMVVSPTAPPTATAASPVTTVQFYRVHNGPGGLTTPVPTDSAGNPIPCYDLVTLTWDSTAKTITKTVALVTNTNCPNAATTSNIIARNVTNFGVTAQTDTLFDIDLQTAASRGGYGVYDLNTQVALGYKP